MATGVNKVILMGNVGKDPVYSKTANETPMATFSLATSKSWKDKTTNLRKERTEWHNIVIFGPGLVSLLQKQKVAKGTKLYLEGELKTTSFKDKISGFMRRNTEIVLQGHDSKLTVVLNKRIDDSHSEYNETHDHPEETHHDDDGEIQYNDESKPHAIPDEEIHEPEDKMPF